MGMPPHDAPSRSPFPAVPGEHPADGGATPGKLLCAALELLGSENALAHRLGITPRVLSRFMSAQNALPAVLLLRTLDILLEERESADPPPRGGIGSPPEEASDA